MNVEWNCYLQPNNIQNLSLAFLVAPLLVLDHVVEYSIEVDNAEEFRVNVLTSAEPAEGQIGCETYLGV
jgi:hypothetical protein